MKGERSYSTPTRTFQTFIFIFHPSFLASSSSTTATSLWCFEMITFLSSWWQMRPWLLKSLLFINFDGGSISIYGVKAKYGEILAAPGQYFIFPPVGKSDLSLWPKPGGQKGVGWIANWRKMSPLEVPCHLKNPREGLLYLGECDISWELWWFCFCWFWSNVAIKVLDRNPLEHTEVLVGKRERGIFCQKERLSRFYYTTSTQRYGH